MRVPTAQQTASQTIAAKAHAYGMRPERVDGNDAVAVYIAMREDGVESFVELGGKVLGPMIGRIDREAATASLITMEDLEVFAKDIGA